MNFCISSVNHPVNRPQPKRSKTALSKIPQLRIHSSDRFGLHERVHGSRGQSHKESKKSQQKYGLFKQLIDGIHFVQKRHHTGTIDFIKNHIRSRRQWNHNLPPGTVGRIHCQAEAVILPADIRQTPGALAELLESTVRITGDLPIFCRVSRQGYAEFLEGNIPLDWEKIERTVLPFC